MADTPANEFENVNVSDDSSSNSNSNSNSDSNANTSVEGEDQLAEQINGEVEPPMEESVVEAPVEEAPVEEAPVEEVPVPVPVSAAPGKKPMSAKAQDLQGRRKALLGEMAQEYAKVFGDDKKAPKAKAYHAASLLSIREKEGEKAYKAKLREYINENRGKYTAKSAKPSMVPMNNSAKTKTVKAPKATAAPKTVNATNAKAVAINAIQTMGETIKGLIDTMIETSKALQKENGATAMLRAANSAASVAAKAAATNGTIKKARKERSNKGGTHKKRLSTIAEE